MGGVYSAVGEGVYRRRLFLWPGFAQGFEYSHRVDALVMGRPLCRIVDNGRNPAKRSDGASEILKFKHVGGGLVVKDNVPLKQFAIADASRNFIWPMRGSRVTRLWCRATRWRPRSPCVMPGKAILKAAIYTIRKVCPHPHSEPMTGR